MTNCIKYDEDTSYFSVTINGLQVGKVKSRITKPMTNVNVYAGNNYLPAANAKYDNLIWEEISGGTDPPIISQCPHKYITTIGRIGSKTIENVRSWEACGQLCLNRLGCKYWTWHHGDGDQGLKYKCVTMKDATGKKIDWNTVSGRKDCI